MDKCPDCKAKLETGSRALNFSLNMVDRSILVDCMQCGVRVRLKGVLGQAESCLGLWNVICDVTYIYIICWGWKKIVIVKNGMSNI